MPVQKRRQKGFGVSTGLQISHFYWLLSSDSLAVKGLRREKTKGYSMLERRVRGKGPHGMGGGGGGVKGFGAGGEREMEA